MKKIFYSMLMLAMAATTFMSCEDVPMPYSWPETETGETPTETVEPKGSGTVDDPYNVAGAQALIQTLGADVNSEEIYCKGYISQINEISTSYGNATFFISDVKGSTAGQLEVYRANSVGGKKFTSEDEIKEGDEVVIRGKVVNFRGNTPEFTQGCYIYSLNGGGGGGDTPKPGEPSGDGTLANPYNAAGANAFVKSLPADQNSDKDIYIKGKIIDITDNNQFNVQYGNATFYISDDGTENSEKFYVFRTLYLGNVKYTGGTLPKKGDEVIICGKVVNYKGNTPETVQNQSYIYSLNGSGGGDTPQPGGATGNGTLANPYNAAGANAFVKSLPADQNSDKDIYIKGKIIDISENNQFNTQYGNCTFYISDDGTDSGEKFYVFRTLYLGNVKYTEGVKPKKGDEVIICGKVVNYKGNTPETVQNQSYIYSLNGNTGGGDTPQPGGATGNGTLANPYNAAGANAYVSSLPADQNSDKDIYIKGKIISISDNNQFSTQYGNCTFYISDDGTNNGEKFYVFRTLYLGNVKYTEGVKPKAGDEVIICGKVVNYKGNTPETVQNQSYIYSLNGNTGSGGGGGGDTPSGNAGTTAANPFTPQQANAFVSGLPADQNTDKDYYIKGKIISISDNNQFNAKYGNCTFYISADGTDGGEKFYVFRTLYLGNVKYTEGTLPKAGDEVIICGKLVNYKGNTPETVQNQSYIYSLNGSTSAGAKRYAPRRR